MTLRQTVLQTSHLRKVFGKAKPFTAVADLSLEIRAGEILGLLGPNGAGKSTTIQMLLGALTPDSGTISFFGEDFATNRSALMQRIGYASGYSRLPGNLTVWENLDIQARLYCLPARKRKERIESIIESFSLDSMARKVCGPLSAGQATRVILAKAFISEPDLVLLDEPTAALDPDIASEVRHFVQREQRNRKVAMLYTSHNMMEVSELCGRVAFLQRGHLVALDTPQELARRSAQSRLRLCAPCDGKKIAAMLQVHGHETEWKHNWVEVELDHDQIPRVLGELCRSGLHFVDLEIVRPTLEDYFIKLSKQGRDLQNVA